MAAAFAAATPLSALDMTTLNLADPHLNLVPRTAAEQARITAATAATSGFTSAEPFEDHPAGAATVRARKDDEAFSQHSANIGFEQQLEFKLGNGLFKKIRVFAPASTRASDGLGPLHNARSCQRCHIKDGRGHPPQGADDSAVSMFLRLSIPGDAPVEMAAVRDYIGTAPDPNYGSQLQDFSPPGLAPEYQFSVTYRDIEVALSGGESASLRAPSYRALNLGYGPLHADAMLSPRVAPPMIGLGLIEAIPVADILAQADQDDANGDGISGRANLVWSSEYDQVMLGRFGLKAGQPTVHQQSAAAFSGDIGISTPLYPEPWRECTETQTDCRNATHGDGDVRGTEIDQPNMDLVTFYSRNLGVPARRDLDNPKVLRGKQVFYDSGCSNCHTPKFVTHRLSDRPEGRATGREWRTPPLWGVGLTQQVSDQAGYLHDGRARSLLEAVLWHGGEAQPARDTVVQLAPDDRAALIRFLESL